MRYDDVPEEEEVIAWFKDIGIRDFIDQSGPEGDLVLSILLQRRVLVDTKRGMQGLVVGELVAFVRHEDSTLDLGLGKGPASKELKRLGLRVHEGYLHLANGSQWIEEALKETPFSTGWRTAIRTIDGAKPWHNPMYFHPGLGGRVTSVPLSALPTDAPETGY